MAERGRAGLFSGLRVDQPASDPRASRLRNRIVPYRWDLATDQLAWGPGAADLAGLPPLTMFADGASFERALEPEGGLGRAEAIAGAARSDAAHGTPYRARYALRLKPDRLVMVEDTGRWHADAMGRPALATGLLRIEAGGGEATSLSAALRARSALVAAILDDVVEAQRSRRALTLLVGLVDEDPDRPALARLSDRIRPLMRRRDRFIPYGPNRFAIALACCPASEAEGAVKRFASLLSSGPDAPAGLRLGLASAPEDALDAPELLRRAEETLSPVGPSGLPVRNRTERPRPPVGTSGEAILSALNARRVDIALTRALDGHSRAGVFATAHAGIEDEGGRFSPVGDLAAAAEREGLAELVDARVLESICGHLATHPEARLVWRVTRITLRSTEFLTLLAAHLGARPGIESRLIVEVPEETLTESRLRGRLDAMKALGVATMLGGFGQGHLSARQLRGLPVDLMRIDPRFVQVIDRSPEDRLFLRTLLDLAQHLGIATLADGVADEAGFRLLAGWGADYLEGPVTGPALRPKAAGSAVIRRTRVA